MCNHFNKDKELVWKEINSDKYLNVHYKGCDNTYFSIVRMQYFFFTSDAIDILCLVYSSFYANKITYLSFIGDSLQT